MAALLTLDDCIAAVEEAFRVHGEGRALGPGVLAIHAPDGGLHVKAAGLALSRLYIAAKFNTNFPGNGARWGLPTIQGVVVLADGETGRPLALMDSMELTALRTGAATAVAARHLARPDATVATIVGCGRQGRIQLAALARVRRLERAWAVDLDPGAARRFADEMSTSLDLDVRPGELARVASQSDICVTCTPSRVPLLHRGDVRPGTFVAAVGADNEQKVEIEPALMAASTIVVDSLEQCAAIGDLRHAIAGGVLSVADVHATLADVIAGRRPGRTTDAEITIFDSTGVAIEDVAAAAVVYEGAVRAARGVTIDLAG